MMIIPNLDPTARPESPHHWTALEFWDGGFAAELVHIRKGEKRPALSGWTVHMMTRPEAEQIDNAGDNFGVRSRYFPAFDVDVTNDLMAKLVSEVICKRFTNVALRVGAAPKVLFPFRLAAGAAPFKKIVLPFTFAGDRHKVEVLGDGQQYVVGGIHPSTQRPYQWPQGCPTADSLPEIDEEKAQELLEEIRKALEAAGAECESVTGGGGKTDRSSINQELLKAESLDTLRQAVEAIPNGPDVTREFWIRMCAAIKAAAADSDDGGLALWMSWAAKWPDPRADPDNDLRAWETLTPPFEIGIGWIYSEARKHDWGNAAEEFGVVPGAKAPEESAEPAKKTAEQLLLPLMGPENDNDDGNAERVALLHGDKIRYCTAQGRWYGWDGARWKGLPSSDGPPPLVMTYTTSTIRTLQRMAKTHIEGRDRLEKFTKQSLMLPRLRSAAVHAQTKPGIEIEAGVLDAKTGLLNVRNGTIDLRTGQLRPHRRDDMFTKVVHCDYDPSAKCPLWLESIHRAMGGNSRMVDYLQVAFGYTFTGRGSEKAIFLCHGPQDTGKTTITQTVANLMEEYATKLRTEHFLSRRGKNQESPSHVLLDLSNLEGKRFAMIPEAPEGGEWNDWLLKDLVPGGEGQLKVRRLFRDFDFIRVGFALWVDTNHMPSVRSMEGVQNRFKIIPFNQPVGAKDPLMAEKLRAEWPGILAWIVAGAVRYYRDGLIHPPEVEAAVQKYADQQNSLTAWRDECLILAETGYTPTSELAESYQQFCANHRKAIQSQKEILAAYTAWGLTPHRTGQSRGYRGVRLASDPFEAIDATEDGAPN